MKTAHKINAPLLTEEQQKIVNEAIENGIPANVAFEMCKQHFKRLGMMMIAVADKIEMQPMTKEEFEAMETKAAETAPTTGPMQ